MENVAHVFTRSGGTPVIASRTRLPHTIRPDWRGNLAVNRRLGSAALDNTTLARQMLRERRNGSSHRLRDAQSIMCMNFVPDRRLLIRAVSAQMLDSSSSGDPQ